MSQLKEQIIKEAKRFKSQMLACSILCWIFSIPILFIDVREGTFIIPVAAVIFTIIYLQMRHKIKQYEES